LRRSTTSSWRTPAICGGWPAADRQAHAGVLVAQALHHGNAHREQICAILTGAGMQPRDVQAWAYADATGRGGERSPD
jgi:hypothetical protein